MKEQVRIGSFSAFWGDTPTAASQLLRAPLPRLDYLVGDYLAEVTLCILARRRTRYISDFLRDVWRPLMGEIVARGVRVVTNAGGMDPAALKREMDELNRAAGLDPMPVVAAVLGDDLSGRPRDAFRPFADEAMWAEGRELMSCNAYLGAWPVADALGRGATVVVTGRCVDSALVLGPLLYEFGWTPDRLDLLSAGTLAGHVIECGCQCTGGNFTDWRDSVTGGPGGWSDVGFPVAECRPDGTFDVVKPPGTGGLVSFGTVAEQVLYEIGDPAAYAMPDVVCDWRAVRVREVGPGRVRVSGARGRPPGGFYKVGATAAAGQSAAALLLVTGNDAASRARCVADAILDRTRRVLGPAAGAALRSSVQTLGAEHTYGPRAAAGARATREVVLRVAVRHDDPRALAVFAREVAPASTGMAPGICGVTNGRARPTPCVEYFSALVPKAAVRVALLLGDAAEEAEVPGGRDPGQHPVQGGGGGGGGAADDAAGDAAAAEAEAAFAASAGDPTVLVPLESLAYGRSGDKGDTCNIGVIARRPEFVPALRRALTADLVLAHMPHLLTGQVTRYELPGLGAFNFVCTRSLGGGGTVSLLVDRQGKSYAQKLLAAAVAVPQRLAAAHGLPSAAAAALSRL